MKENKTLSVCVGLWPGTTIDENEKIGLEAMLSNLAENPVRIEEIDHVCLDEVGLEVTDDIEHDFVVNAQKVAPLLGEYYITVGELATPFREAFACVAPFVKQNSTWVGHAEKVVGPDGKFIRWANTY